MPVLDFARVALPTFFTVLALVYATRLAGTYARSGVRLQVRGQPGSAQHVTHSLFRTLRIAVWLVTLVRVPFPAFDAQIGVFPTLMTPPVVVSGLVLLVAGFTFASFVHHFMAQDWRSGADEKAATMLITSGPFSRVRNPMFLGVLLAQIGFFLALPSLFSLLCLIAGFISVVVQSRHEERVLHRRFGVAYADYRAATPAWLPRLGQPYEAGPVASGRSSRAPHSAQEPS